jgi:hypothetical protein
MKVAFLVFLACTAMMAQESTKTSDQTATPDAPGMSASEQLERSLRAESATYHPTPPDDLWINPQSGQWERKPEYENPNFRVWDKLFIATHSVLLASVVFDAEVTHQGLAHHKCLEANNEGHISRTELYTNGLLPFAAITGFDVLVKYGWRNWVGKTITIVEPVAGTVGHIRGGVLWFTYGCW